MKRKSEVEELAFRRCKRCMSPLEEADETLRSVRLCLVTAGSPKERHDAEKKQEGIGALTSGQ